MKLAIEVISKETIIPSSPTPDHLRHYQLSFLDQVSPLVYQPLVLFYANSYGTNQFNSTAISNQLKGSLSDVLTYFYPLAGRVIGNNFVDCNDKGIPYVETKVKCKLFDIIQNPVPGELNHLIPFQLDYVTDINFGVQFNVFDCGVIAIGVCLSHQIADSLSVVTFVNSWAAISSGQTELPKPQFVLAKLFAPKDTSGFDTRSGITKENIISKRFVFDAPVIEALRAKYSDSPSFKNEEPPSRVQALSTFIWSRYVAMTQVESAPSRAYVVAHAVNLRPRMVPPLPQNSFGNYFRFTMTISSLKSGEECYGVLKQVREQIKKIDEDYVRKIQEDANKHLDFLEDSANRILVKGEMVSFNFTSLCKFPLNDADFGWGRPTWVGSSALPFKNLVVFFDTKSGGGIEAYISLKVEDMAKFEVDKELLTCVKL